MKIISTAIILSIGLMASGCQTKPIQAMSYSEKMALAKKLQSICEQNGLKPSTEAYNNCFHSELSREAYQRNANALKTQAALSSLASGMQNASNNYYRAAATTSAQRPVTCTRIAGPVPTVRCY